MGSQEGPGTFTFDGRSITAAPGQTIAGALHQAGVHVVSRSFKYHRARGLFCATYAYAEVAPDMAFLFLPKTKKMRKAHAEVA